MGATLRRVTVGGGQSAGQNADQVAGSGMDATQAWRAVRDLADIQYTPLPVTPPTPPPQMPGWLQALGRLIEAIFAPIGRMLGLSGSWLYYGLVAIGACLALYLLWWLLWPLVEQWRGRAPKAEEPPAWTPPRADAVALLAEADRLAAAGRYGEATHLLLRRSVDQIATARPEWVQPASTAREIAGLALLPEAGRHAFGTIAGRVERCLFALRDLDAQDWSAARGAYAQFAKIELRA